MLTKGAVAKPQDAISSDEAVKDPYMLEFLNLKDEYSESELEEALIHRLEDFLLELGSDFTFVGRQRRLRIDQTWYRVDLLFFPRRLRCLIIIDLMPVPSLAIQMQFVKLKQALEQAAEVQTKQMVSVEAILPALCNQLLSQQ